MDNSQRSHSQLMEMNTVLDTICLMESTRNSQHSSRAYLLRTLRWRRYIFAGFFAHHKRVLIILFTHHPQLFAKVQEAIRKDIERAFGVLQARWHILTNGGRLWSDLDLKAIVKCCIILHNMIIEDNKRQKEPDPYIDRETQFIVRPAESNTAWTQNWAGYLARYRDMKDKRAHHQLKADLVQHLWIAKGSGEVGLTSNN